MTGGLSIGYGRTGPRLFNRIRLENDMEQVTPQQIQNAIVIIDRTIAEAKLTKEGRQVAEGSIAIVVNVINTLYSEKQAVKEPEEKEVKKKDGK